MSAPNQAVLTRACEALAARDDALSAAYARVGLPTWRVADANYQTLARSVVYQLISTKAADAIWQRVLARYVAVTPEAICGDDQAELQACGLSAPKLAHLNAIAQAILQGRLDFDRLEAAPVSNARAELLAVKGIGPWTAESFLMMALGHLDAFPIGDVGLMEAYKRLSGSPTRDDKKGFTARAENWRPYRAVAAHLLYDWFNATR